MSKITSKQLAVLVLMSSNVLWGLSTSSTKGSFYACKGHLVVKNNLAQCEGVFLSEKPKSECLSEEETVCGQEKVVKHDNGGGLISACTKEKISPKAFIEKKSAVCGQATIGPEVRIVNKSLIKGYTQITGKTQISKTNIVGESNLQNALVLNTKVNGAIEVKNAKLNEVEILGVAKLFSSSVEDSTINGSLKSLDSEIKKLELKGNMVINNSQSTDQELKGRIYIKSQ